MANNATAVDNGASSITDDQGNVWAIDSNYQITVNGVVDQTTANVIQLDTVNGVIWQENTAGLWYSKTTPSDTWTSGTTTDPQATGVSRSWHPTDGTNAANGQNWSPTGAPQRGDALSITSGRLDLPAYDLRGDTLTLADDNVYQQQITLGLFQGSTLNLAGSATLSNTVTIDAQGNDTLNALNVGIVAGNIDLQTIGSNLSITGSMRFIYNLNVTGADSTLTNDGTVELHDATIHSRLSGDGSYNLLPYHDNVGVTMIDGRVGGELTFNLDGHDLGTRLVLDQPQTFDAKINIVAPNDSIVLQGLSATSYSMLNDILTLYNGDNAVDHLGLSNPANAALTVTQTLAGSGVGAGVDLYFGQAPSGATVLPQHA